MATFLPPSCRRPRGVRASGQAGFTLIELLIVVVVMGILAAIALPSFLNQTAKAKQAGALKYIGVINRSQQMYFLKHSHFAPSPVELGFDLGSAPAGYTYTVTTNQGIMTSTQATPTSPALRGYAGVAFTTVSAGGEARVDTLICQGTPDTAPTPTVVNTASGKKQVTNCKTL